jgi:hypothetical protein
MAELERELVELGRRLEFPPTPNLASAVRARLGERRRPWFAVHRRALALGFALLALAIGVAFAVPPARTAILRVFGVGGVEIKLVERLPATPVGKRLRLGDRVTLTEARRRTDFPVRVPQAGGFADPDAVFVSDAVPGGSVSFVYGSETRPRALLTQFEATAGAFAQKSVGPGTRLELVRIGGVGGYWLEGKPHTFAFRNRNGVIQFGTLRLARNTLIWERGGVTLRLEGDLTKAEALRVASSLR